MRLQDLVAGLPKTRLLYMEDAYLKTASAKALRVEPEKKNKAYLVLDATIFHPKSGGQPSDKGTISGTDFKISIEKAMGVEGSIVHWGEVSEGKPAAVDVEVEIDWVARYLYMRRHTAGHMFDHCLNAVTGKMIETFDSWLGESCYVGYSGSSPSKELMAAAAEMANRMIKEGASVRTETITRDALNRIAPDAPNIYRLPPLEEYRVVTIEGCKPIPCGGTHVKNIREIGCFELNSVEASDTQFKVYYNVT